MNKTKLLTTALLLFTATTQLSGAMGKDEIETKFTYDHDVKMRDAQNMHTYLTFNKNNNEFDMGNNSPESIILEKSEHYTSESIFN